MSYRINLYNFSLLLLILLNFLSLTLTYDPKIVLIQFKTKSLRAEEEEDDSYYPPYYEPDEEGEINEDPFPFPYIPTKKVYNQSTFLNQWFYNGIYSEFTVSSKYLHSYITLQNSKLLLDKCIEEKMRSGIHYYDNLYSPINSTSFIKNLN